MIERHVVLQGRVGVGMSAVKRCIGGGLSKMGEIPDRQLMDDPWAVSIWNRTNILAPMCWRGIRLHHDCEKRQCVS